MPSISSTTISPSAAATQRRGSGSGPDCPAGSAADPAEPGRTGDRRRRGRARLAIAPRSRCPRPSVACTSCAVRDRHRAAHRRAAQRRSDAAARPRPVSGRRTADTAARPPRRSPTARLRCAADHSARRLPPVSGVVTRAAGHPASGVTLAPRGTMQMDRSALPGEADEAGPAPGRCGCPGATRLSASSTAAHINWSRVGGEFCSRTTLLPDRRPTARGDLRRARSRCHAEHPTAGADAPRPAAVRQSRTQLGIRLGRGIHACSLSTGLTSANTSSSANLWITPTPADLSETRRVLTRLSSDKSVSGREGDNVSG